MSIDDEIREAVLAGDFELAKQLAEGGETKSSNTPKKRGRPKKVESQIVTPQTRRKVAFPDFKNTFVDDGKLTGREKKEKKMYVKAPVPRERPEANRVNAVCSRCGKKENIPPSEYILLGEDKRYYCNTCAGSVR